jgi:hypothetical protein
MNAKIAAKDIIFDIRIMFAILFTVCLLYLPAKEVKEFLWVSCPQYKAAPK